MKPTLLCFMVYVTSVSPFVLQCSNPRSICMGVQRPVDAPATSSAVRTPATRLSAVLDRRQLIERTVAVVPLLLMGGKPARADKTDTPAPAWVEPEVTLKGFMDISIGGESVGRLVIALYGGVVPSTVKNFVSLLTGDNPDGTTYKGTSAYRVLDGLTIQMGAVGSPNGKDGKAASGEPFPKENFEISHGKEGILSMVNNMDGKNDSRFFITLKDDSGWADNRYVAFGRVVEGMDVVRKVENVKVEGGTNAPKKPVVIDDCGLLDTGRSGLTL